MAVKKPKAPAEELEQTVQGDQPDDAKKTRAKSKAAPKKSQSGTKAKSSKSTAEETGTVAPKAKLLSQSVPNENQLYQLVTDVKRKPSLIKRRTICSTCWSLIKLDVSSLIILRALRRSKAPLLQSCTTARSR